MNDFPETRRSKRRKVSGDLPAHKETSPPDLRRETEEPSSTGQRSVKHRGSNGRFQKKQGPIGSGDDEERPSLATPSRTKRSVRSAGQSREAQEQKEDHETTPSKARASTRQRETPKRFHDTVDNARSQRHRGRGSPTIDDSRTGKSERTNGVSFSENVVEITPSRRGRAEREYVGDDNQDIWDVPTDDVRSASADDNGEADDIPPAQLEQNLADAAEPPMEVEELPDYALEFAELCEQNELDDELDILVRNVLERLTGKRLIAPHGLEPEYKTVHQLIEQTVVAGEGNSLLVLGSRGSGKTTLVETAISSLSRDHKNDFHVVRLNGFLHTDDRIALREIWRQLGRETNMEDEMNKVTSYADTMASLLALLSHPEELFGVSEDPNVVATAKSVVIVLDEFDLFSYHPRQTLLYNLFDIAQARKAPVAVIGLTTKVDVTENLEKRVKSRFSHRYVFLPRPRSFSDFSEVCMAALITDKSECGSKGAQLLHKGWRKYLQDLFSDSAFQTHLQQIFHQTKSVKDFFASALVPFSTLQHSIYNSRSKEMSSSLRIPGPHAFMANSLACPDPAPLPFPSYATASTSTTSLPVSLLLTATRLTALHEPGQSTNHASAPLTLSFPAVYTEYVRLLTSAKASASASGAAVTAGRIWGRDVAREAWEKLEDWGLVVPVGGGGGMGDGRMFRVEISFEEVLDGVGTGNAGVLGRWWRET